MTRSFFFRGAARIDMSEDKDQGHVRIAREFSIAQHARQTGNEGMVRVCTRRAAGLAIAHWIKQNQKLGWRSDTMNQLETVARMHRSLRTSGRLLENSQQELPGNLHHHSQQIPSLTPRSSSTISYHKSTRELTMKCLLFFLLIPLFEAVGQPLRLDMEVSAKRRTEFMRQINPRSVAIFACKPEYIRNGDVEYDYRQENNFYYLTGFEEPESILLLNPSAARYRYVLFVRGRNPVMETFQGPRSGVDGAMTTFHADTAVLFSDFMESVTSFASNAGTLYYSFGINPMIDERIRSAFLESGTSSWSIQDPSPILAEMRLIKNEGDWEMGFQKAMDISVEGQVDAIKAIRPGMFEYEVQAVFEYVYRKNGSPRNGYACIIGSGPNSCTLHYDRNDRRMQDGDVVVMDCGAEYGYYSADITRTLPVNGKFTNEQREIYQIVLDAQNAAIRMVRPGLIKGSLDSVMKETLGTGLLSRGFIKEKKDATLFTVHGFSHWLGLDVHDVGKTTADGQSRPLVAGMVFTLEPGIYVRPEIFDKLKDLRYTEEEIARLRVRLGRYMNTGVRIEDDIVVTETGCKNLTEVVPRDVGAIEALMRH